MSIPNPNVPVTPPVTTPAADPKAAAPVVPSGADPKANLTSEAAKEAMRKLKIKHDDGKEEEVAEDEVLSVYRQRKGHQRAANKELQEGKAARKQAEEFIAMMKDPEKFFETGQKLGHDPRKLAEAYLAKQIEDELLDPRDKELRDTKAKLKEMQDLDTRQKESVQAKRDAALKAKFAKDYNEQFVSALKETGLPGNKAMVAEMATYIGRAAELGFKMTAIEAARLVDEDVQMRLKRQIGDSDGEVLLRLLGEDAANKIRQYDVSRLKNPEAGLQSEDAHASRGDRRQRRSHAQRLSREAWNKMNRGG